MDLQGSCIKNSDPFRASDQWKLSYSYDGSKFDQQGNFQVHIFEGAAPLDAAVNELGKSGISSTAFYHFANGQVQYHHTDSVCTSP